MRISGTQLEILKKLFMPPRIGTAAGVNRDSLIGSRLFYVEGNRDTGVVTEVLDDRVRLNGREEYVCFWAIDAGWYDAVRPMGAKK